MENKRVIRINMPSMSVSNMRITHVEGKADKPITDRDRYNALYGDYGPGPVTLAYGDLTQGYFGKFNGADLLTPSSLRELVGLRSGVNIGDDITFHKFYLNGDIVYLPEDNFFEGVSVTEMQDLNLLSGKVIKLFGQKYMLKAPSLAPLGNGTYHIETRVDGDLELDINGYFASANGVFDCELSQTLLTLAKDFTDTKVNSVPPMFFDDLPTLNDLNLPWLGAKLTTDSPLLLGSDQLTFNHTYPSQYEMDNVTFRGITVGGVYQNEDTKKTQFTHLLSASRLKGMSKLCYRPMLVLIK